MEKDFGRIKKNEMTDILIRVDDFGGKKGLTIREFTTSERYTGFTKSGTRIPVESFNEFKKIINSIEESDFNDSHVVTHKNGRSQKLDNKKIHDEVNSTEKEVDKDFF